MFEEKYIKAFFFLLRAGLWNKPTHGGDCFPLTAGEWESLYKHAVRQTVEGILFDGVQQLAPALQPSMDLLIKWVVRVEKIKQRNTWMNGLLEEQLHFFTSYDLSPLLLKGQGVAKCYINPDRRISGDIDWYFERSEAFDRANKLLIDSGVEVTFQAGYTSAYCWKGCTVDQHQRLLDIHNPFVKSYLQDLEASQKLQTATLLLNNMSVVSLPSPLLQVVQVNVHILKHLLSFGIGIRQLCDVANLYSYYRCQLDTASLTRIYSKLGISRWIDLLHQLLVDFMGLPEELLPSPLARINDAYWMMSEIWQGGNFGFYDQAHTQHVNGQFVRRRSEMKRVWRNFWKYLPYAPKEAISFPIMHYYSSICKR